MEWMTPELAPYLVFTACYLLAVIGGISWVVRTEIDNRREMRGNKPCPCGSGKKYKHCCGEE